MNLAGMLGLFRVELQARSTYRAQIVLGALGWVVPLAFMALWRGAAADNPVEGIGQAQFTTYFAVLLALSNLSLTGNVVFAMSSRIHSGQLSVMLMRPMPPTVAPVLESAATNVYRLPVVVVGVPLIVILGGGSTQTRLSTWLSAVLVAVLGAVAVAYVATIVSTLAFWLTKAEGVMGLVIGLEWVLGGMVAPVDLLPQPLPGALVHQPFWFAYGAPAQLLAGIGDVSAFRVIVEAAVWIAGLHLLFRVVWRRALRRFEAVGT